MEDRSDQPKHGLGHLVKVDSQTRKKRGEGRGIRIAPKNFYGVAVLTEVLDEDLFPRAPVPRHDGGRRMTWRWILITTRFACQPRKGRLRTQRPCRRGPKKKEKA
jgi:hypothetical protein